jgi:hypothetical protein
MQNLFKDLEQLLLQCDDYSIDGKLNKPKIEEQALSLAPQLLKILLSRNHSAYFYPQCLGVIV